MDVNAARQTIADMNAHKINWDDNLRARANDAITAAGGGSNGGSGGLDVVGNAQKLLDFQKQANAPVVASLQSQQPGLQDKYTNLVNSIKGNQQLDTNRQTLATSNELGQRGIQSDSGVYQQNMANSLTPIDTQYSGLLSQANSGSIQDTQNLALQIAQLQAGNPDTAISGGLQLGGLQNQASSIASQNALNAALAQQAQGQGAYLQAQVPYYGALTNSIGGQNLSAIQNLARRLGGIG